MKLYLESVFANGSVMTEDGSRLYVATAGSPESVAAVVLVHGFTMAIPFWEKQIQYLAETFYVIAYDQRGHGRSGRPGGDGVSLTVLGRDLEAVILGCVPEGLPVIVVGHSMGGMAIMGWAAQGAAAGRVSGVVLCNTAAHNVRRAILRYLPGPIASVVAVGLFRLVASPLPIRGPLVAVFDRLLGLLAFGAGDHHDDLARTSAMVRQTHPRSRARYGRFLESVDAREGLAKLDLPVIVIGGSKDRLAPLDHSRELVRLAPQARLHVLEGRGHQAPMEAAPEVNKLIRDFVDDVVRVNRSSDPQGA